VATNPRTRKPSRTAPFSFRYTLPVAIWVETRLRTSLSLAGSRLRLCGCQPKVTGPILTRATARCHNLTTTHHSMYASKPIYTSALQQRIARVSEPTLRPNGEPLRQVTTGCEPRLPHLASRYYPNNGALVLSTHVKQRSASPTVHRDTSQNAGGTHACLSTYPNFDGSSVTVLSLLAISKDHRLKSKPGGRSGGLSDTARSTKVCSKRHRSGLAAPCCRVYAAQVRSALRLRHGYHGTEFAF
jgi:hypothetical protein